MRKFLFLFCFVLLSCASSEDVNIEREYGKRVRQIGLTPVYPPREEFQIGDIFAVSYVPGTDDSVRVWIGELPGLIDEAERFMGDRLIFRETSTDNNQKDLFRPGKLLQRRVANVETLPVAAFPSITVDSGLTAGLGITKILRSIGIGASQATKVTLRFPEVRTYWVPKIKAETDFKPREVAVGLYRKPFQTLGRTKGSDGKEIPCGYNPIDDALIRELELSKLRGENKVLDIKKRTLGAMVITRVYVTRKIRYTYSNGAIIAAGIRRSEEEGEQGPPLFEPESVSVSNSITVSEDAATGVTTIAQDDLRNEIAALRAQVQALSNNSSAGESFYFESWNGLGITFVQDFERPVSIGYDAVSIRLVDTQTGNNLVMGEFNCPSQKN